VQGPRRRLRERRDLPPVLPRGRGRTGQGQSVVALRRFGTSSPSGTNSATPIPPRSKGYGFAEMVDGSVTDTVVSTLHGLQMGPGRPITVSRAKGATSSSSSGGGGGSGSFGLTPGVGGSSSNNIPLGQRSGSSSAAASAAPLFLQHPAPAAVAAPPPPPPLPAPTVTAATTGGAH